MRKAFVAAVVTLAIAVAGTACDEPQATDSPGPEPVGRAQPSQAAPQPPTVPQASPQPAVATAAQVQTPTPSPTPSPPPTPSPTPVPPPTSTPEPTAAPAEIPLSAPDILEASAAAMQALESFHFEMDIEIKVSAQGVTLEVPMTFVGDFKAPDRIKGTMSVAVAFFTIETEMISIGDTSYTRDFETGKWEVTTGEEAFFTGPGEFIAVGATSLKDIDLVGVETLDGVEVYHLDAVALPGTFGGGGGDYTVSYWIGVEDGRLRQVVAEGELELGEGGDPLLEGLGAGSGTVSITLKFSEFGKDVTIEPPELEPVSLPPPRPRTPPAMRSTS